MSTINEIKAYLNEKLSYEVIHTIINQGMALGVVFYKVLSDFEYEQASIENLAQSVLVGMSDEEDMHLLYFTYKEAESFLLFNVKNNNLTISIANCDDWEIYYNKEQFVDFAKYIDFLTTLLSDYKIIKLETITDN